MWFRMLKSLQEIFGMLNLQTQMMNIRPKRIYRTMKKCAC